MTGVAGGSNQTTLASTYKLLAGSPLHVYTNPHAHAIIPPAPFAARVPMLTSFNTVK